MVEYVSLGDYHSAVGFLLASPPDRSARYYRDALCTLALAHAAAAVPDGRQQAGGSMTRQDSVLSGTASDASAALPQPPPASSLLWQAAKVLIPPWMSLHLKACRLCASVCDRPERCSSP